MKLDWDKTLSCAFAAVGSVLVILVMVLAVQLLYLATINIHHEIVTTHIKNKEKLQELEKEIQDGKDN